MSPGLVSQIYVDLKEILQQLPLFFCVLLPSCCCSRHPGIPAEISTGTASRHKGAFMLYQNLVSPMKLGHWAEFMHPDPTAQQHGVEARDPGVRGGDEFG
jgi:hypothetical protein